MPRACPRPRSVARLRDAHQDEDKHEALSLRALKPTYAGRGQARGIVPTRLPKPLSVVRWRVRSARWGLHLDTSV